MLRKNSRRTNQETSSTDERLGLDQNGTWKESAPKPYVEDG